jgi:hypothetical protein
MTCFTCDHDKYLTKMCDYKEHEKKWADEDHVPCRGRRLHAAGGAKIALCVPQAPQKCDSTMTST